jgi:L-rhamnose-H+ transport protein
MAFIILVANMWGLVLKEWKGVRKQTYAAVIIGIIVIILSVLIVGYGNNIKP